MKIKTVYEQNKVPSPVRTVYGSDLFGIISVNNGEEEEASTCCQRCCEVLTYGDTKKFPLKFLISRLKEVASEYFLAESCLGFALTKIGEDLISVVRRGDCSVEVIRKDGEVITYSPREHNDVPNQDELIFKKNDLAGIILSYKHSSNDTEVAELMLDFSPSSKD